MRRVHVEQRGPLITIRGATTFRPSEDAVARFAAKLRVDDRRFILEFPSEQEAAGALDQMVSCRALGADALPEDTIFSGGEADALAGGLGTGTGRCD